MVNLQDAFLSQVTQEGQTCTIYLSKGVQLKGKVLGFDAFTIFLEDREGRRHMIYKHSVTTVSPTQPLSVDLFKAQPRAGS